MVNPLLEATMKTRMTMANDKAVEAAGDAVDTLKELLKSSDESLRLQAAQTILRYTLAE